jgi:hypothetical protein
VSELGTLETPVLLTNTFAVGCCANALIRRALVTNPAIGRQLATVNPVVLECNDGFLSDIQTMAVTEAHADAAIEAAAEEFAVWGSRGWRGDELLRTEGRHRDGVPAPASERSDVRFIDIISLDRAGCGFDGQRVALPTTPQPQQPHH